MVGSMVDPDLDLIQSIYLELSPTAIDPIVPGLDFSRTDSEPILSIFGCAFRYQNFAHGWSSEEK